MTTASSTTYSKPPYKNYEEVFHPYPVQISSHNAFRAMEHDGKIFKLITHKIKGVKYIYWHADKNGIELWHKKNNVEAWVQTIHKLDERFVFAILRSGASLRTITEDPEENTECDPNDMLGVDSTEDSENDVVQMCDSTQSEVSYESNANVDTPDIEEEVDALTEEMKVSMDIQSSTESEVTWALAHLDHFKNRTTYKELFDIPDLTGTTPTYTFTPQLMEAMDRVLTSYHLPQCQTLLYDKHTCSLVWLRRDCSSYEIYTHTQNALDFAKRFILNTMFQLIVSGTVEPTHLTPVTPYWISAYHQLQCKHMVQKHKYNRNKGESINACLYQNRKHCKRQCMHS
jgi:hypothetical protein